MHLEAHSLLSLTSHQLSVLFFCYMSGVIPLYLYPYRILATSVILFRVLMSPSDAQVKYVDGRKGPLGSEDKYTKNVNCNVHGPKILQHFFLRQWFREVGCGEMR